MLYPEELQGQNSFSSWRVRRQCRRVRCSDLPYGSKWQNSCYPRIPQHLLDRLCFP